MTLDAEERRLVLRSAVIGVVVWALVFALARSVHFVFETIVHVVEGSPTPALVLIPLVVGSLIMAAFARFRTSAVHYRDDSGHIHELVDVEGDGLERAIALYYSSEPALERTIIGQAGVAARWDLPTFSLAFRKLFATLVTLGSGGSGGLEASVALIGESAAAGLLKPRRVHPRIRRAASPLLGLWKWWTASHPDDLQTAQLGGIAAAISTLLGAPFAAAFFATEVMYRRRPIIGKLVYSLIPALIAFFLTHVYAGHEPMFSLPAAHTAEASVEYYGGLVGLAFCIAIVASIFSKLRDMTTPRLHAIRNVWLRQVVGALITGGVALAVVLWGDGNLDHVLGPGESAIQSALNGDLGLELALLLLCAKMLATLSTIGSGGSAGLLIPATFFGSMVAVAVAEPLQMPPAAFVVPAITASLVSIVNVPLAAILLAVEMFGSEFMVPALITLVAASIFSNRVSIYRTQREQHDRREILPGFGVRRVGVPEHWQGKTLAELEIRRRHGVTVVGIIEQGQSGASQMRLDPGATMPLSAGDTLVLIGKDDLLNRFSTKLVEEDEAVRSTRMPPQIV